MTAITRHATSVPATTDAAAKNLKGLQQSSLSRPEPKRLSQGSAAELSTLPSGKVRDQFDESTLPNSLKGANASRGVLIAADTRTPEQRRRSAAEYSMQVATAVNDNAGVLQSSLDNLLYFTRVQPTMQRVGDAAMTLVRLNLTRSNLSTTYTAAIAEMKLQQQAAWRAGDVAQFRRLDSTIRTTIQARDARVGQLNQAITRTTTFLNRNLQFVNDSPVLNTLKRFGDALNVAGAALTTIEAMMEGPQQDIRTRSIAALMKGGGNYFTAIASASFPPLALGIAVDGLLLGGNVSGAMNSAIDTGVGLLEAAGGNWSTLQRLYEQNRTGANGPIIQRATELGDWLNRVLFGG